MVAQNSGKRNQDAHRLRLEIGNVAARGQAMNRFMNQIAVMRATIIIAGTAIAQEKDQPLLWTPRYLGSGEIALPERVVQSDLVFSGKIIALEPKDVEATFSAELPNKVDYRIAV